MAEFTDWNGANVRTVPAPMELFEAGYELMAEQRGMTTDPRLLSDDVLAECLTAISGGYCDTANALEEHIAAQRDENAAQAERIRELTEQLELSDEHTEDARTALEAFQQFDGDEDLWAMMKTERDAAVARVKELEHCLFKQQHEIQQTLGRALGYPKIWTHPDIGVVGSDTPVAAVPAGETVHHLTDADLDRIARRMLRMFMESRIDGPTVAAAVETVTPNA